MRGARKSEISSTRLHNGCTSKSNFCKVVALKNKVKILLAHWFDNEESKH